ncbi:MAG TPA: hypothetical protein ENH82_14270 [bacterium]|nr:hypothetical protein [bacterium]
MDLLDMTVVEIKDLYELYIECNKALQAIEAASYFVDNGISDWENADHEKLVEFVSIAYRISHSMLRENSCYDFHEKWRKEVDMVLKAAEEVGYSKYKIPFEKKNKE